MTYIVDARVDACDLHLSDAKIFNDFTMNARTSHFTYDKGLLLFQSVFIYLC
jgi:hypothetical protein